MFSHILFAVLALLYYLFKLLFQSVYGNPRMFREIMRRSASAVETLAAQYGGRVQRRHPRGGWNWALPDGSRMEIQRRGRPTLTFHIPYATPQCSMTFQRIPRLPFAFLEAFLGEGSRIGTHPYLITATNGDVLPTLKQEPEFLWLFDNLSKAGYSLHLDGRGLRAWKRMKLHDASDIALYEQYRWLRDFARFCAMPFSVPVHPLESIARCAYCREEAPAGPDVIHCASCGTPHHQECFELNGRCSLFGCNSMQPVTTQANVAGM